MIEQLKNYKGDCLVDQNGNYSYKDLVEQVIEYQNLLQTKIHVYDRVLIYSDYNFQSIALLVALSELNINIIPVVKTTEAEFEQKVGITNPNWILSFDDEKKLNIVNNESLNAERKFDEVVKNGETGIILFSSGTTGSPKVMIQNLTKIISSLKPPRRQKSLKFIILLMFDHIGGLNTVLNCLISGSPFVIPGNRNPAQIIQLIDQHKVHILPTTPTFLNLMLIDDSFNPKKLDSLKLITYGTERMSESLLVKLNSTLPFVKMLQTFGTSETGILKTESKSSGSLFFKIVDNDKEYKILQNELYLRSKTQVKGYINHSNDNFFEDGWYATGDIVETDEDGYIKIVGRKNKIINVGGLKVLPKEVEDLINTIDEVLECKVYGEINNLVGNIVCATVFTHVESTRELKNKIKTICRQNLDKYKIPVKIYFKNLEMTSRGKINDNQD